MESLLKGFLYGISLFIYSSAAIAGSNDASDPSATVEKHFLTNGLKVILVPSANAKTVQIKVKVRAGHFHERKGKVGTAHLLEHYLFTDAKMDRSTTYLEAIKEKGGSVNATTGHKETNYFATVPPSQGHWIISHFGRMLVDKAFDEELVQHSKKPVVLEIGRPLLPDYLVHLVNAVMPQWVMPADFWETEFGIAEPRYTRSSAKINTASINAQELRDFYERYYHASNMTLFLTGSFDPIAALRVISTAFDRLPTREISGWQEQTPKSNFSQYVRETVTSGIPELEVGTKLADAGLGEEVATKAYLHHLSYRLMRNLRNSKGETYTVIPDVDTRKGFGKATVRLEVPPEKYGANLELVRSLIESEARAGNISEQMFEEAKRQYLEKLRLIDRDAGSMMSVAETWDWLDRNHPTRDPGATPYRTLRAMDYPSYVAHLKRVFVPNMRYEERERPPFIFPFELGILCLFSFAGWMMFARKIFARPFDHGAIRSVRKIQFPPAYTLQIFVVLGVFGLSMVAWVATDRFWVVSGLVGRSALVSSYLQWVVSIGEMIFITTFLFGGVGRKVMIVDDAIVIKSLTFRSDRIDFDQIENISMTSPVRVIFSPRCLWRLRFNLDYYNPQLWTPGILIRCRGRRDVFLGIRNARAAFAELSAEVVRHRQKKLEIYKAAA